MRALKSMVVGAVMLSPAWAQDVEAELAWRETVTGQIEALRDDDGVRALSYAGAVFRANYQANPQQFAQDVARSGYGPIGESRSHSFGDFRELAPGVVLQAVEFVDAKGRVWEAVYQLADERDEGWRVQGVMLRSTPGLGI